MSISFEQTIIPKMPTVPFHIELNQGDELIVEEIIDLVPQLRLLVFGKWRDKAVFAKIFISKNKNKRQMENELNGIKLLTDHHFKTPELYYYGNDKSENMFILIFERIYAKDLTELWKKRNSIDDVLAYIKEIIILMAQQNDAGLAQLDPNLSNFMLTTKGIFTIDGDMIKKLSKLNAEKISLSALARYFSHFGLEMNQHSMNLFKLYCETRGWVMSFTSYCRFYFLLRSWQRARWKRLKEKMMKNSRNYLSLTKENFKIIINRKYIYNCFENLLSDPEAFFSKLQSGPGDNLKKTPLIYDSNANRQFDIHYFSAHNLGQKLGQLISQPARRMWREAHRKQFDGIRTANPVAVVVKKRKKMIEESYYFCER